MRALLSREPGGPDTLRLEEVDDPKPGPGELLQAIRNEIGKFPEYDKLSVGFPGYVKDGTVFTAPSLS